MGVSGPVAVVILVGALIAQGSALLTASRNADTKVEQARENWQRRHESMQAHKFTVDSSSWNNGQGQLTLTMTNTGLVNMNVSHVEVLLDGVIKADSTYISRQVEGVTTNVWPPGQELVLVITSPSKPGDAMVVSPWGLQNTKRGI